MCGVVHQSLKAAAMSTLTPLSKQLRQPLHSTPRSRSTTRLHLLPSQPLSTSSSSERGVLATAFTASTIQYVEDDLELRSLISRNSNKLVVVDWFATWCGPCRAIAPLYEQLSEENRNVVFVGADIEEMPDASAQAGVQAVPCFHFIKGNELVAVLTGADEVKLRELVKEHG